MTDRVTRYLVIESFTLRRAAAAPGAPRTAVRTVYGAGTLVTPDVRRAALAAGISPATFIRKRIRLAPER